MKISLVRCVVFLACAIAAASISPSRVKAQKDEGASAAKQPEMVEIKDAIARFKDRDVEGTLKNLEAAVKKNADLPPAEVLLAEFFAQTNSIQGYVAWMEKAVAKYPEDPEAYVRKAELALRNGQYTEADLLYKKAAELMPNFKGNQKRKNDLLPRIARGQATVAEGRENWPLSQKHIEDWIKLEPKSDQALVGLARVLFKQKKPRESYEKLKEAKAANPKNLAPEAQLAMFYLDFGDKDQTKQWTEQALKSWPKEELTWRIAAVIAVQLEQFDEAQKRAAKAYELDSNSLPAKLLLGNVALFKKDYREAEKYFEAVHLSTPESFEASNNLALALVEQKDEGKKRRALGFAQNNAQQYQKTQNGTEALSTLGWVLYKMGKPEEAQRYLRSAINAGNFQPDTAYYFAVVEKEMGQKETAKKVLEQTLTSSPQPFTMKPEAKLLLEQLSR
jgi:tetratricopeptide (TPR) repeat protein